jgi:hypothetical protein
VEKNLICISIGKVNTTFLVRNKKLTAAIRKRYHGYIGTITNKRPFIECTFSWHTFSSLQRVKLVSIGPRGWHATRYDFTCSWDNSHGHASLWPSLYSFDAMLRVLVATRHVSHNGFLLHASSVVRNKKGYIFTGPSGSGKSTISRLSNCKTILNDEIVSVAIDKSGTVRVSGTPFWGEMGSGPAISKSFPLKSIYFLKKNSRTYVKAINIPDAIGKLLRCVCVFGNSRHEMDTTLDLCGRILSSVEYGDLYFEKKPLDWKKIELKRAKCFRRDRKTCRPDGAIQQWQLVSSTNIPRLRRSCM